MIKKANNLFSYVLIFNLLFSISSSLYANFLTDEQIAGIQHTFAKMDSHKPYSYDPSEFISRKYRSKNTVFELKNFPDLIFKIDEGFDPGKRISLNKEASEIITTHNLTRLVLPKTQLVRVVFSDGENIDIIVEEKLPLDTWGQLMQYYRQIDEGDQQIDAEFNELMSQLGTFIGLFHINDLKWDNAPLIKGQIKLALVDLEKIGALTPLQVIGGDPNYDSIVHEKHMDLLINEWQKYNFLREEYLSQVETLKERAKKMRAEYFEKKRLLERKKELFPLLNRPLDIKLGPEVQDATVLKHGSAVITNLKYAWSVRPKDFKTAESGLDIRELEHQKLHRWIAQDLKEEGTYNDVNIVKINEVELGFEGCTFEQGCSEESYWPPKLRDGLLRPLLQYLKDSQQIVDFELLKNGDIKMSRKL